MLDNTAQPPTPAFYYPPHPARFFGTLELPWFDADEWKWRYARARFLLPWPPRRVVTWTMIIVTFAMYLLTQLGPKQPLWGISQVMFDFGILRYYVIEQGQIWRLASAVLLHANFAHWFENAVFLYFIGRVVEPTFGSWRMLAIFMLGGIAATTLTSTEVAGMRVGIGMSGSLYGLIGAQIAHLHNNRAVIIDYKRRIRRNLFWVGVLVLFNGIALLTASRMAEQIGLSVDVLGHLGGFVAGYLMARVVGPLLTFSAATLPAPDGRIPVAVTDARPFTSASFWRIAVPTAVFIAGALIVERF